MFRMQGPALPTLPPLAVLRAPVVEKESPGGGATLLREALPMLLPRVIRAKVLVPPTMWLAALVPTLTATPRWGTMPTPAAMSLPVGAEQMPGRVSRLVQLAGPPAAMLLPVGPTRLPSPMLPSPRRLPGGGRG